MNKVKIILLASFLFAFQIVFAQDEKEKFAVYVYGASDAGVNKSLGNKLGAAIAKSGKYAEIEDSEAFYRETSKSQEVGAGQIVKVAKRHGADVVCIVSMTEALGAYSISARMVKTSNSQAIKTVSLDRSIKTLEDLTRVSNGLAALLLQPPSKVSSQAAAKEPTADAISPTSAAPEQCEGKYNINELIAKIQHGLPEQLKECGTKLAKDIALSKTPFGKKPPPEPAPFMKQCAIDGIKEKLPAGFPGLDKAISDMQNFIQGVTSLAMDGGSIDPKKLMDAIGNMDIDNLLSSIKKLSDEFSCLVDEPYEYIEEEDDKESSSESKKRNVSQSLGFRLGMNSSHLYATNGSASGNYESATGFQAGLIYDFDFGEGKWGKIFHLQSGIMYIQKGAADSRSPYIDNAITSHYIEPLVLLSLKFSTFRFNFGMYDAICIGSDSEAFEKGFDIGISTGLGFEMDMFYIEVFYEYGLWNIIYGEVINEYMEHYNRTLGLNLGVNLKL